MPQYAYAGTSLVIQMLFTDQLFVELNTGLLLEISELMLAKQLTHTGESETPFAAVPAFWSDQYDLQIQSFGLPSIATEVAVIESDADGNCITEYSDASGLVGVVGINRTSEVARYRTLLNARI